MDINYTFLAVFRPLSNYPDDETFPGPLSLRTEGQLYFGNSPRALEKIQASLKQRLPHVVVLDRSAIPESEYTALKQWTGCDEKLRDAGSTLWLVALNPAPLYSIERSSLGVTLGHERMFFNRGQAVEAYMQRTGQGASNLGANRGGRTLRKVRSILRCERCISDPQRHLGMPCSSCGAHSTGTS